MLGEEGLTEVIIVVIGGKTESVTRYTNATLRLYVLFKTSISETVRPPGGSRSPKLLLEAVMSISEAMSGDDSSVIPLIQLCCNPTRRRAARIALYCFVRIMYPCAMRLSSMNSIARPKKAVAPRSSERGPRQGGAAFIR